MQTRCLSIWAHALVDSIPYSNRCHMALDQENGRGYEEGVESLSTLSEVPDGKVRGHTTRVDGNPTNTSMKT